MSRGGNTLGLLRTVVALAVLLVLNAARPAAAAPPPDACVQCNKRCVAECSDDFLLSRVCETDPHCKSFNESRGCKECKDLNMKACAADCYANQCAVIKGCPVDVTTLCRDCRATCQSGCNSTTATAAECQFQCRPQKEVCLGCVNSTTFSQNNGGGDRRPLFPDIIPALVPGTVPCREDCIVDTSCSTWGLCSPTSSSRCLRCPPPKLSCEGCMTEAIARCNTQCIARDCVQGSGCPSVLAP